MIKTAVVILNWNGKNLLEQFLEGVVGCSTRADCQVFVADNCSTDGSVEWVREHFPGLGLIVMDRNYGFAEGYNRALAEIEADYFMLLNSDVSVTEGWLEPLEGILDLDETIAAVMPKILSYHDPDSFEYAGASGGFIDRFGFPFCRGRIFEDVEPDEGQYNQRMEIFWASGAAMLVRADLYSLSGGLDPDFFAHMEEIDLCWRLKNMGYRIVAEPASSVYHVGGATLPMNHPRKLFLNFRNNLLLLGKNLSREDLFPILFLRGLLDGVAALRFLARLEIRNFLSVWKAHFAFYGSLPGLFRKRRTLVRRFIGYHHPEIFPGSIVFQYFMKGQKKFSSLKPWLKKARRIEPQQDENPLC